MKKGVRWLGGMFLLCLQGILMGQPAFQKNFGGGGVDSGRDLEICSNGDYLVVGVTSSGTAVGDSDIFVTRLTKFGDILWTKRYGGTGDELAWSIRPSGDGNYIIAGSTNSIGNGDYDIYLVKVTPNGDFLWGKTYGTPRRDDGKEAVATADGGIIIAGYSSGPGAEQYYSTLIKTDAQGNQQWFRQYAVTQNIWLGGGYSVKPTPDGGYVFFGQLFHGSDFENTDMYLLKVNANGDQIWSKTIIQPLKDRGQYVHVNSDGSIITVGDQMNGSAGDYDVNLRKFDSSGNLLWSRLYGGDRKDIGKNVQPTSDGGYIVCGNSRSFGLVGPDFYLVKTDADGNALWSKLYGGSDHEHCYVAKQLPDGYVAFGHTRSFSSSIDAYLVKVDASGISSVSELAAGEINVFPNPSNGTFRLQLNDTRLREEVRVTVTNVLGARIFTAVLDKNEEIQLDLQVSTGMYFLTAESGNDKIVKKLIVEN